MSFTVLLPARLASTRLPNKPLADIAGLPMIVRVAQRAATSSARAVVVAADHADIVAACRAHGVEVVLTRTDHPTGSDRLAEACTLLGQRSECVMGTAAHAIDSAAELDNPNVVKVVLDAAGRAMYFSRASIPWWRDARAAGASPLPSPPALRHVGIYSYQAGFLRRFPTLPVAPIEKIESLEQLRVLWHGERIAVHVSESAPGPGVDTPEDLARVRALFAR